MRAKFSKLKNFATQNSFHTSENYFLFEAVFLVVFLAVVFLAAVFLTVLLAVVFLAVVLLAAVFLTGMKFTSLLVKHEGAIENINGQDKVHLEYIKSLNDNDCQYTTF